MTALLGIPSTWSMMKTYFIGQLDIREPPFCSQAKTTYQQFAFLTLNVKYYLRIFFNMVKKRTYNKVAMFPFSAKNIFSDIEKDRVYM